MATIRVLIDEAGQTPEEIELELDLASFTMRESVRLEEGIGEVTFGRLLRGELDPAELTSPKIVQALIYAKLKTIRPEISMEGFDLDLAELGELVSEATMGKDPEAEASATGSSA